MDKRQREIVLGMAYQLWQEIGSDVEACAAGCGERLTKGASAEAICDACRLETNARSDEERASLAEFRKLAWGTQLRVVSVVI